MKASIKVIWHDLSLLDILKMLIPSKTKKYINKWLSLKDNIREVVIDKPWYDDGVYVVVYFEDIELRSDGTLHHRYHVRFHFDGALSEIAELENMRNADELCIWLDLRTAS